MEKFDSARDFSKETQKEERNQVAETIRAQRREYFDNKETLQRNLQELLADAEAKKLQAGEVRTNIESAEAGIEKSSQNFLRRLLERGKLKRLQTELGTAKVTEETLAEELEALESAKLEIEQSLQDRTALDSARQQLDSFYQKTETDWNNYEDDREAGNVKNIMQERGAFMVHAFIDPTLSASDENGLMRKELSWRDKLDLLILEPTLSASAVDVNHPKTFAPVGVLLGDGQVLRASAQDIGSRSVDQKNRTFGGFMHAERIRGQIDESLQQDKTQGGWTEFVVSNPKVSGLFFRLDESNKLDDLTFGSDATMPDIVKTAQERNLPLFALQNGEFYSITPEEALALSAPKQTQVSEKVGLNTYERTITERPKLDLKKENLLTPTTATELPTEIEDQKREAILERLMTDSPFQLRRFPEAQQVASRAEGRSLYNLYQEGSTEEPAEKKKTTIPAYVAGNVDPIEVTILKTVPGPTHLEHYVELDDGKRAIWRESRNPVSAQSRFRAGSTYTQDRLINQGASLNVGLAYVRTERPNPKVTDIIEAAKKEIEGMVVWVKKWEADGADLYAEQSKRTIRNIASSLYGIAEEARSVGDNAIAEIAESVANENFPLEEYQTMLAQRVSESGTFKVTREELLGQ